MKKYIYSLLTTALLVLSAGCSKDDDGSKTIHSGVVGEWHQTRWSNEMPEDFDVYVEFRTDGRCTIFQRVESSVFEKRTGTFNVEGTRLSGTYSSGTPWRLDYEYELSGDGNTLTLTSQAEESVYVRTTIPEAIRNVPEVRSALSEDFLLIF